MIWLVTATPFEVDSAYFIQRYKDKITCICTGVGVPATLYWLQRHWCHAATKPTLIIHAGIAGVYENLYPLGSVVQVQEDMFADLGAEDASGEWLSLGELQLSAPNDAPFRDGWLHNEYTSLAAPLVGVRAITVNTVSGTADTIQRRWERFGAALETMETAAVAYFCLLEGVPYISVRGVSNRVEPRNRSTWQVKEAIANLGKELEILVERLVTNGA